jgi:hypothetical protein
MTSTTAVPSPDSAAPSTPCCSQDKQSTCCDQSEKSSCCGAEKTAAGGCGCQ